MGISIKERKVVVGPLVVAESVEVFVMPAQAQSVLHDEPHAGTREFLSLNTEEKFP